MDDEKIVLESLRIEEEIFDVISTTSYPIAISALSIVLVSGFVSKNVDKKDFMKMMSDAFDDLLISKMKLNDISSY